MVVKGRNFKLFIVFKLQLVKFNIVFLCSTDDLKKHGKL